MWNLPPGDSAELTFCASAIRFKWEMPKFVFNSDGR
jgi:hypothetical protein